MNQEHDNASIYDLTVEMFNCQGRNMPNKITVFGRFYKKAFKLKYRRPRLINILENIDMGV